MALVLCVTACAGGGAKQSSTTTRTAASTTVAAKTGSAAGITSVQARAESLCRAAFGDRYLNAGPGTVGEVRSWESGGPSPGVRIGKDAFRGASPRSLAAWCWLGRPGLYKSYAVRPGFAPVLMGAVGGATITAPPPAGPPTLP